MQKVKHALIGGGTGFIGKRLCQTLMKGGYDVTVISRMPGKKSMTWHDLKEKGIPKTVNFVVNLCGQNVLDVTRRWTPGFQQNVYNSRIKTAAALVKAITDTRGQIDTFVNISGCSSYLPTENHVYSEDNSVANFDFMSNLCIDWEKAATLPNSVNCRCVKIRTGVVIGRGGGMIQSIYLPFLMGLGGPMGKGNQPLPWIHIDDLCRLIQYTLENFEVKGVVNGVAPEIVTNREFSKAFASSLRRPSFFSVPEFVVKAIFGTERSALLLNGAKIKPKKILAHGFEFKYPTAKSACDEVVNSKV